MRHLSGKWKITLLFLGSVFLYGIYVSFFTSTVYVDADEEIYLALAKSFHYAGRFAVNNEIVNYSCVLYSLLISLLYSFYSPERILLLMRLTGVVVMCSSIFPLWLLAKKVMQGNERRALAFAGLCMLLPCMLNGAYLMQETLVYPLFMWFLYLFYRQAEGVEGNRLKTGHWIIVGMGILSALCFFTKTYMIFLPAVVNLQWLYLCMKKRKRCFRQLVLYDGIYAGLMAAGYLGIYAVNGFAPGSNHYAGQLSWLFPITLRTVLAGAVDSLIYWALFLLNMGIFPIVALWICRRHWKGADREFHGFCLLGILILVEEIIVLIVLTEEGVHSLPHKFLFRYFQIFVPPVLLLFDRVRCRRELYRKKPVYVITALCTAAAGIYLWVLGGNTRQAITDGFWFMLIENTAKNLLPYADVLGVLVIGTGAVASAVWLSRESEKRFVWAERGALAILLLIWLVSAALLPVYTNRIVGGTQIEKDSIQIAQYLNREKYGQVYYVDESDGDDNSRNFYGYIRQEYSVIYGEEIADILQMTDQPAAFLAPKTTDMPELGLKEVLPGTERIALYVAD